MELEESTFLTSDYITMLQSSIQSMLHHEASLMAQMGKNLPAMQEIQIQSLGWEDPLKEEMATHSSILPGEFHRQSMVGYSPWGCKELDTTEWESIHLNNLRPKSSILLLKVFKGGCHAVLSSFSHVWLCATKGKYIDLNETNNLKT